MAAAAKEEARFTLDTLISQWAKLHLAGKRLRYATEAERALRVAFASHLARPASALTHAAVTAVLDKLAGDGKAPIAGRTMAYGRACYGWAVKRRRLALNPFAGLPVIEGANPSRDRVLTDAEVGAIWRASGAMGLPFGPLVRLLLLTAQRREEVAALRWSRIVGRPVDVDAAGGTREERQGACRASLRAGAGDPRECSAHRRARLGVQRYWHHGAKRVQQGEAGLGCRHCEGSSAREIAGWRFHDFRRTAVTWLAGAGFPPHVADRLLNHVGGSIQGVAAIYQRSEFLAERKAALAAWGAHVLQCGAGAIAADNVAVLSDERAQRRVLSIAEPQKLTAQTFQRAVARKTRDQQLNALAHS